MTSTDIGLRLMNERAPSLQGKLTFERPDESESIIDSEIALRLLSGSEINLSRCISVQRPSKNVSVSVTIFLSLT